MKTGVKLIAEERQEQINKHGFSLEEDAKFYQQNELIKGALFCISTENFEWPYKWDGIFRSKILNKNRIDQLKIAGALIAAEIDRLQSLCHPKKDELPLVAPLEDEKYSTALTKYLENGINYLADPIKCAEMEDLKQFASDSFFYGYLFALNRFGLY